LYDVYDVVEAVNCSVSGCSRRVGAFVGAWCICWEETEKQCAREDEAVDHEG
jgi:hypothetical protein